MNTHDTKEKLEIEELIEKVIRLRQKNAIHLFTLMSVIATITATVTALVIKLT
ncbi:MAG: hypothetical protein ACC707_16350 [Thiohalomonadales bacterium]